MESIRPSSDLRNKYPEMSRLTRETREPIMITVNGKEDTVLMGHAQYRRMKAELELLTILSESEEEVNEGKTSLIQDTFDGIRRNLQMGKRS